MRLYLISIFTFLTLLGYGQEESTTISIKDIRKDLKYLDAMLQTKSSYQGLNGYDYREDFAAFLLRAETESISEFEFGLFLSRTIGNIGDRHSYVKGYTPRDSLFFPLAFAPYLDRVVVLKYDSEKREYSFLNPDFPFLESINDLPIEEIMPNILPGQELAPKASYQLYAVRDLRDVETIFRILGIDLADSASVTLESEEGKQLTSSVKLVPGSERARLWDERFYRRIFRIKEEKYNDKEYIQRFFKLEKDIAYIQIPDMIGKEDSPAFFAKLIDFTGQAQDSKALIIDVRDNGGGTRDLIQELAGYFVHPDSVYVANVVKQRGKQPLNKSLKDDMQYRYLYSADELDQRENEAVDQFMSSFKPMYELDIEKFSEYHYYVLNGMKLSEGKYHYDKPIYILCNERSFSAASVLVTVFKDLPNIQIAGVTTDGSSGNSQRFNLPKSEFRGKISTMVSFQKDGRVLDGFGTAPDILIERNLDQIFWKEDYQLLKLKEIIMNQ